MIITPEIAGAIDQSVLCWLATVSEDGFPNVSPKEAFLHDGQGRILIAHIASPQSARNLEHDSRVCVSFVDVFRQKGYKVRGTATIVRPGDSGHEARLEQVQATIGDRFPIHAIIVVEPLEVEAIIAPSYQLFPDTGPRDRIRESLETYRVAHYAHQVGQELRAPGQESR